MNTPATTTSSGFLPPILSSSSNKPAFESFDTYVFELFKAALKEDKKSSQDLLKDPTFGKRIVDTLPGASIKAPRIVVLNLLARNALRNLPKQDIENLIYEVGKSTYVASCAKDDVKALYKGLFSCPQSKGFSQNDLLDFERFTIEPLQVPLFKRILNHASFEGVSITTINDLARRHLGLLPKPHIQYLVYTIDQGDSDTENKVKALKWSLFSYTESQSFSKSEVMDLANSVSRALRPYILKWALEHPSFSKASLEELKFLTEKLEETKCPRDASIKFLSSLIKHPSLPLLAINR